MEWGLQGEMNSILWNDDDDDDVAVGSLVPRNTNSNTMIDSTNNKRSPAPSMAAYGHQLHHQQQQYGSRSRSSEANLFDGDGSGSADAENEENDHDDGLDRSGMHPRCNKKKKMRHTPRQIQELEALFKECPHPDEKQRMEISQRLSLNSRQVKFWFQNRRTQMKTKMERHENSILMQENEKLRVESMSLKEAMGSPLCMNCGAPAILGIDETSSLDMQHLRMENSRVRDELDRVYTLANKFLGGTVLKW